MNANLLNSHLSTLEPSEHTSQNGSSASQNGQVSEETLGAMRVALSFPGCHRKGGVERIVFECGRFLASRGHTVDVYANEWLPDVEQPSIRYHAVPMTRKPFFMAVPSYFKACSRRLRHERFDVLNTHGTVCPVGGVHWVQSVQAAWLEQSARVRPPLSAARLKQRVNPLHPLLLRLEEKHFGERQYARVIVTTRDVQADLHRIYGVPLEDISIIPNGFAPTEFNPERRRQQRDEMRAKLGLEPHHVALLFVANELERKGYTTILEALQRLKRPELRVLVVGRPDVAQVRAGAEEAGLSDQVMACGPTSDVGAFHAAADLFVLPTQYEAFCLAILEALGSGLPVITSNVPGAYNAIQPGVNGAIIEDPRSGEQLAEALSPFLEPEIRAAFSERAPASVEQYQWPAVLRRYESVLWQYRRSPR